MMINSFSPALQEKLRKIAREHGANNSRYFEVRFGEFNVSYQHPRKHKRWNGYIDYTPAKTVLTLPEDGNEIVAWIKLELL
jgi:hypothetical protein